MKGFAIFLLLTLFSCKKDTVETKYVPAWIKQMLPYTNGQVVTFVNGSGHEVQAVIEMKYGYVEKSACAGCDPYVREQWVSINFTVAARPFINMSADVRPDIFLTIFSPLDNFQVGAGFDFKTEEGVAKPSCSAPRQTCVGTKILNGTTYPDVLEVISGATASNVLTKAYFTISKGVIGFAYGDGTTYSLKT